jgi:hypothetical protein
MKESFVMRNHLEVRIWSGVLLLLMLLNIVWSPVGGTVHAQTQTVDPKPTPTTAPDKKQVLSPRVVWDKPAKITIDPARAIAGGFVIKFAEGSHVRLGANGLFVDDKAIQANAEEQLRLTRAGLNPADAALELANVSSLLSAAQSTYGFNVTWGLRPSSFVYSTSDPNADAPFREKGELEQRAGEELADLDLYYVVHAKDFHDLPAEQDLINRLNTSRVVEQVYPLAPAEGAQAAGPTPDISRQQGYLSPAPLGVDGLNARTRPGGRGEGVRLIDVEYDWVTDHEDFPPTDPPQLFWGGRPLCPYVRSASSHGTAVMGVIAARNNGLGITGLAPNVQYGLSSVCRPADYAWAFLVALFSGDNVAGRTHNMAVANAIGLAASALRPGDVVLVEQHTFGPSTGVPCEARGSCGNWEWVPMEYYPESFDVIRRATAQGVIVVEAAGNGSQNLDQAVYGNRFTSPGRHSNAVLVGASGAGDRRPASFSNSSARIDVHAWGMGVVTLGSLNGDDTGPPPFDSPLRSPTRYYTNSFGGTSSASAIVAGAVASLQGARLASGRLPLMPTEVRTILHATGTPQAGAFDRPIGAQPNLRAAIDLATSASGSFVGPGSYTIRSRSSGKVLDIDVAWWHGQDNGQPLMQWGSHGGLNQQFQVIDAGGGAFTLLPRHSLKAVDVTAASLADHAPLQQWTRHGGDNQRFRIEPVGSFYRIVAVHSRKVLDVPDASRDDGARIQQMPWNGGDNQLFQFIPLP